MLHASETCPLKKPNLQCLQQNDRAMIRQICNVRPQDVVITRSNELLAQLGIEDLDLILKERRLRWYGHVERSSGAIKTAFHIQVEGKGGPGRPKMTWKQLTERDCKEWKLLAINPHDRNMWRSGEQAGYLEGGPLMWMLPLYLHINQKSDYDDIDDQNWKQEAQGPRLAHLSDIATADMQMLCNIFPILLLQLMKRSSFEQFLVMKKSIWT